MSQRKSGYERKERDLYETPEWVTAALIPHLPSGINSIWEPAAGGDKMVDALQKHGGYTVYKSDIATGGDFLKLHSGAIGPWDAIITNPPYELATEFIAKALCHIRTYNGLTAMLLRMDFDHAKTRSHQFGGCDLFSKKVVLTKRIQWFEDSKGSPSFNHAWFIWDWKHSGPPTLAYGP